MRKLMTVAGAVATLMLVGAVGATAQGKIEAGTLTCSGGEGVGLILGSTKSYSCTFEPAGQGRRETYKATVTKIGLDVGVTGKSTMIWTVLAAADALAPRALAGSYGGATADVSLGVGGGAKVLVGGWKSSITLQPVSIQGQTGVNIAVGIAELTLH